MPTQEKKIKIIKKPEKKIKKIIKKPKKITYECETCQKTFEGESYPLSYGCLSVELCKNCYETEKAIIETDSEDEQYEQECAECECILDIDCPIMCHYDEDGENTTLCSNCYWDYGYYKTDKNEDNEEEIKDFIEGQ